MELQQRNPIRSGRLRDAFIANVMGDLLQHLGRLEEAERAFTYGIALAELINSRSTLAAATLGAAEVAAARGDRAASNRHLERGLGIARDMKLGRYVARGERLLAAPAAAAADRA